MSIKGLPPNPNKVRRNADPFENERNSVKPDGERRGPDLPDDRTWSDRTLAWWETWRMSPQAQLMTPTDWDFMLDTAVLHNMMWSPNTRGGGAVGMTQLANAVKSRVAAFGATYEDRLKLRLSITTEEQEIKDAEASVVNYAERLLKRAD